MTFCIIVPFRDRYNHMRLFLPHMISRFRAPIFFIEQDGNDPFNRGKLLNVGFRHYGHKFDYAAYHDIDMLPNKADYSTPNNPTHLATHVEQFAYAMPSPNYFGGVVLFTRDQFDQCGGYSNYFWGWGGEDNELYIRLQNLNIPIDRRDGFYRSLHHARSHPLGFDAEKMKQALLPRAQNDGCWFTDYTVVSENITNHYTHLKVNLYAPSHYPDYG